MNKYTVYVLEIHQVPIHVEATSKEHAIEKAMSCEGTWQTDESEFVETCDSDTWFAELTEEGEPFEPNDREAYTLNKIKELSGLAKKEANAHFKELIDGSIEDLKEELKFIRADPLKNIIKEVKDD
jgi:hypothetical protein